LDADRIVASAGVQTGWQVAHLGCGSGFVTMALARAVGSGGSVVAIDIREEPLQTVRAKADAAGFSHVREVRADLEVLGNTKLSDNSQDLVAIVNVLFQSSKKEAILAEGARILKPGGSLLLVEWRKGAGGFGPPDNLRTDRASLVSLATAVGLRMRQPIEAGQYHDGMIFTK
jgi:ubiquinone/menaquinone biosynthesis C-methylase UbiE